MCTAKFGGQKHKEQAILCIRKNFLTRSKCMLGFGGPYNFEPKQFLLNLHIVHIYIFKSYISQSFYVQISAETLNDIYALINKSKPKI